VISYQRIYEAALRRLAGDQQALKAAMPVLVDADELRSRSDAWYLSMMTRRVFRAGMKHSVIDKRWDYFETVFDHFDVRTCAMITPDDIDRYMQDKGLIRHRRKLASIPGNAHMVLAIREEYGSMGEMLAQWPEYRIVDLWIKFKREGKLLGGRSASAFLRMVGKDSFILTDDVCRALVRLEILDREAKSQGDWRRAQMAIAKWAAEGKCSMADVSRLLSLGVEVGF